MHLKFCQSSLVDIVGKPAMLKSGESICLKVQEPWPMPVDTAAAGKIVLREDSAYRLIGEKLFEKFHG